MAQFHFLSAISICGRQEAKGHSLCVLGVKL